MPFSFFTLPKVPCDAATTCNGHGSCTNDGDCQCDNGFYAASCSGTFSLIYSIIKIFLKVLNALSDGVCLCDMTMNFVQITAPVKF